MKDEALLNAINSVGGVAKLSRLVGVSSPAISQWQRVPAERVIAVEKASGVPRHELRPDIYPPTDASQSVRPSRHRKSPTSPSPNGRQG